MGLNVNNLFVRGELDRVVDTFANIVDVSKWAVAASDAGEGWTQLVESHEATPRDLAAKLSRELRTRVICAEVYEVSGDAALHVFEGGALLEGWSDDSANDPAAKVQAAIRAHGIDAPLMIFRDTVKRSGWRMRAKR